MVELVQTTGFGGKECGPARDLNLLIEIVAATTPSPVVFQISSNILEKFGSLRAVLAADETELRQDNLTPPEVVQELQRLKKLLVAICEADIQGRPLLEDLQSVRTYCKTLLFDKKHEEFHVLFMDKHFHLIASECLAVGGVNHVAVYPRKVMTRALMHGASHLVLVHNHPDGRAQPSLEDTLMTENIVKAGNGLGVHVSDHLIIGDSGDFSFRENGLLD